MKIERNARAEAISRVNVVVNVPQRIMENPYIGDDGKDYHSFEALEKANRRYRGYMAGVQKISFKKL